MTLSLGNVDKYEFLAGKDVLQKKGLLEKTATIQKIEYSLLGKELKTQTGITGKQYQVPDKIFNFNKNNNDNEDNRDEGTITKELDAIM